MEKIPAAQRCRWEKQGLDKMIGFNTDTLTCDRAYVAGYLSLCMNTSTSCEKTKELGYCTFNEKKEKVKKDVQVKLPV